MWQINHAPIARRCYRPSLPNFLWLERDRGFFLCQCCSVINIWRITYKKSKIVDIIEVRSILSLKNMDSQRQRNSPDEVVFCPFKGVGEEGQGGTCLPTFKSGGAQVCLCPPPTFGQSKCSNFIICSYFVIKNTFFQNFLGSLRSPTLINKYFLNFANLKL